jgi:hypothetical protein
MQSGSPTEVLLPLKTDRSGDGCEEAPHMAISLPHAGVAALHAAVLHQ